jgi:cell division protein FtsL
MAMLNRAIARAEAPAASVTLRPKAVLVALAAVLLVLAVGQLVQTSRATTASFKIEEFHRQKLELQTSVSQLEVEISQLSSLARVQQEAKRLGLGPPAAREVVVVSAPGPSGDSAQIPARLLQSPDAAEGGEEPSTWWDGLLSRLPFH